MRKVTSVSLDEKLMEEMEDVIKRKKPVYKGVSHFVSVAIAQLIRREENEGRGVEYNG